MARTTVAGYLEILQDTYLVRLLPAYEARLRVKERKHPKLYWTDPGVVRAMKRQFHAPASEERGALLEGWVGALLHAPQAYRGLYDEIFYWAPAQGGVEVDFLLRRGKQLVAIEVKATASPGPADFAGLRAIGELAATKRRILVHTGDRAFTTAEGIEALPPAAFIRLLADGAL